MLRKLSYLVITILVSSSTLLAQQRYTLTLDVKPVKDTLYLSYIVSDQTPLITPSDTFGVADFVVNYNNLILQPSKAKFKLKGRWDKVTDSLLYKPLNLSFDTTQQWIRVGIERIFTAPLIKLNGIPITINNDTIAKLAIPIKGCKGNTYGISWRTTSPPLGTIVSWGNNDPATLINIRSKFRFENPVLPALNCCDSTFTGLQKNYCTASFSSILVPAIPGGTFSGPGVFSNGIVSYFKPSTAGPGTHTIVYTTPSSSSCPGKKSSQTVVVDPAPCVSTVSENSIETSIPQPQGIFTDCYGQIYVTSSKENAIYKIDTFGIASIIAGDILSAPGFLDGPVTGVGLARFNTPAGIVAVNGIVFVADNGNNRIRKIDGNNVTTLTSGLVSPYGLALSADQTKLYVSEQNGLHLIKEIVIATGVATTLAGSGFGFQDGPGTLAKFNKPAHISVNNNFLYVADQRNNRIRKIDLTTKDVSTIAGTGGTTFDGGDGNVPNATLNQPNSASVDCNGIVYTCEFITHSIRKFTPTPSPGNLFLYSGAYNQQGNIDGNALTARYREPAATSVYVRGFLDIADQGNNRIRRIAIEDWESGAFNGLDTSYCLGDPTSTLQPLTCAGSYTCSDPTLLDTITIGSTVFSTFKPIKVGTFSVSYTYNSGSCPATITRIVKVKPLTKPILGPDKQFCGNNVTLQAQNGPFVAYEWSTNFGSFSPIVTAPNDFLSVSSITSASNTFVLRATNASGCKSTDTILVKQGTIPNFTIESTQGDTLCNGGTTLLKAEISFANFADSANYRFRWNTNLAKDTTTQLLVNSSYDYQFTVSARIGAGCQLTKNRVVTVKNLPQLCISVIKEDLSGNLIKDYGYDSVLVSTVAGLSGVSGDAIGTGSTARFNRPSDLFLLKDTLYIADRANNKIRRLTLNNYNVTDFIGTGATILVDSSLRSAANLSEPNGIAFDKLGNMFVSNLNGQVISKYNKANNKVYTIAGSPNISGTTDGIGSIAKFNQPRQLASDAFGNIFVSDYSNHAIRKLTPVTKSIYNTFNYAGNIGQAPGYLDAKGKNSLLNRPWGIAISQEGKIVFAEEGNHVLRSISVDTTVSTIAGLGTVPGSLPSLPKISLSGSAARFRNPWNITIDKSGVTYLCDSANSVIKKIDQKNNVSLVAGVSGVAGSVNGGAKEATFNTSTGIAIDPKNNDIYVADRETHIIRKIKRNKTIFICSSDTAKDNINPVRIKSNCSWQAGDYKWEWTLNGAPYAAGDDDFPIKTPGVYVLKLTENVKTGVGNATCSSVIFDTVYVRLYPIQKIVITKQPNTVLCPDTFKIELKPDFVSYRWKITQESILFDTTTTSFSQVFDFNLVTKPGSFVYSLSGFSANGCRFDSIRTGVLNRVVASITPSSEIICEGDSVNLQGDAVVLGGIDFPTWISNGSFKQEDPFNVVFKPIKTDTIYFAVTSKAFASTTNTRTCKDTAMAIITVNRAPDAFAGKDTTLCGGIGEAYLNGRLTGNNGKLPFTFTWQNLSNLSDSTKSKSITVTPPSSTNYQFFVRDSVGCIGRDTIRVNLSPKVEANVAFNDTIICPNSSVQLFALGSLGTPFKKSDAYRFAWSPNVALTPNNLIFNPLASPFDPVNKYIVQVSDTLGCTDTASVVVSLTDLKISNKQNDTTVCAETSILIKTTVSGGKPAYDFTWSPSSPQLISNNKILQPIATPKDSISATRYLLSVEDAGGCFVYDTIDITVNENPKVSSKPNKVGADTSVCTGNTAFFKAFSLNGKAPYTYSWTEPLGQNGNISTSVSDTASGIPSAAINAGTIYKYYVSAMDANGCKSKNDSIEVLAFPTPIVNLSAIDTGCFGTNKIYDVSNVSNAGLNLSYSWIGGGTQGAFDYIRIIDSPGKYEVTVIDNNTTCRNKATLNIEFLQPLSNLTLLTPFDLCKNEPLNMIATVVGSSPVVFNWSTNGGGKFLNPTSDTVTSLQDSMSYIPDLLLDPATVNMTVTASNKCDTITGSSPLSQTNSIIYKDVPDAIILGANPPEIFIQTPITFTQGSFGFDDLQWNFGDGTPQAIVNSTAPSVVYTFLSNGNFVATLTATKINGCKDIDELRLDVIKNQILYIPNVFSPSSNEFKNNSLRVMGMNITSQNFDFEIYNRWGEIVYQTNDFTEANAVGWNGKYKNTGQPQAMGVYTYLIKGKFFDGTPFDKVGNVTLLR